jgi:hypothetical protein
MVAIAEASSGMARQGEDQQLGEIVKEDVACFFTPQLSSNHVSTVAELDSRFEVRGGVYKRILQTIDTSRSIRIG